MPLITAKREGEESQGQLQLSIPDRCLFKLLLQTTSEGHSAVVAFSLCHLRLEMFLLMSEMNLPKI